jgi:hypothetical protein
MKISVFYRGNNYEFNSELIIELLKVKEEGINENTVISTNYNVDDLKQIISFYNNTKKKNLKLRGNKNAKQKFLLKKVNQRVIKNIKKIITPKLFMKMNEIPHNIPSLNNLNNIKNESLIAFEEKQKIKYKLFKCKLVHQHKKNFTVHNKAYDFKQYAHLEILSVYEGFLTIFPQFKNMVEIQKFSFVAWKIDKLIKANDNSDGDDLPFVPLPITEEQKGNDNSGAESSSDSDSNNEDESSDESSDECDGDSDDGFDSRANCGGDGSLVGNRFGDAGISNDVVSSSSSGSYVGNGNNLGNFVGNSVVFGSSTNYNNNINNNGNYSNNDNNFRNNFRNGNNNTNYRVTGGSIDNGSVGNGVDLNSNGNVGSSNYRNSNSNDGNVNNYNGGDNGRNSIINDNVSNSTINCNNLNSNPSGSGNGINSHAVGGINNNNIYSGSIIGNNFNNNNNTSNNGFSNSNPVSNSTGNNVVGSNRIINRNDDFDNVSRNNVNSIISGSGSSSNTNNSITAGNVTSNFNNGVGNLTSGGNDNNNGNNNGENASVNVNNSVMGGIVTGNVRSGNGNIAGNESIQIITMNRNQLYKYPVFNAQDTIAEKNLKKQIYLLLNELRKEKGEKKRKIEELLIEQQFSSDLSKLYEKKKKKMKKLNGSDNSNNLNEIETEIEIKLFEKKRKVNEKFLNELYKLSKGKAMYKVLKKFDELSNFKNKKLTTPRAFKKSSYKDECFEVEKLIEFINFINYYNCDCGKKYVEFKGNVASTVDPTLVSMRTFQKNLLNGTVSYE